MGNLHSHFAAILLLAAAPLVAAPLPAEMQALADARPKTQQPLEPKHATPCVGGFAGAYPCSNIDLLAFVPVGSFGATTTNSMWGWTDPVSGTEYAVVGANNRTVFYDLTSPTHPRYVGWLPTHTGSSIWRDVRTYANHAFIVSDNNGAHGMQVFDLTRLRGVTVPTQFTENAWYNRFGNGHTIAINEATGFAYVVGSTSTGAGQTNCSGGLHMIDIHTPSVPTFAGCVNTGAYTHESQCWIYNGPDATYQGHEICFNANGPTDKLAIVDVSNKAAPVTLANPGYAGAGYPHQGWLTEDHRYLLVNDELDEESFGHNARTYVWDVSDLDAPVLRGFHQHALGVIDHNLYVHGKYVYESNYESGVRILEIVNPSTATLQEVAFFDTYPASNQAEFNGSWNNYRFPGSGNVIATGIDEGFFVLEPHLCSTPAAPTGLTATPNGANRVDLAWTAAAGTGWRVERAQGGCGGTFATVADALASPSFSDTSASGTVSYGYRVLTTAASGETCSSTPSACVEAQTTGACTAAPVFQGVAAATSPGGADCHVGLSWSAAAPACGSASYNVYRGVLSGFVPSPATRIGQGVAGLAYDDAGAPSGTPRFYVVRAVDSVSGAEDDNAVERRAAAVGPMGDGAFTTGAEPGDVILDSTGESAPEAGKAAKHIGWHMTGVRKHSGVQAFWSTQSTNLCVSLVTAPIVLTASQSPQLSFWSAHDIRSGDAAVVELSLDGTSWTRLAPVGGYGGVVSTGGNLCGITQGSAAYTNAVPTTPQLTFVQRTFDLAAYAGQSVQLRWLYRSDTGVGASSVGEGWYVDDIAISHAQVPGSCVASGDAVFADGFE